MCIRDRQSTWGYNQNQLLLVNENGDILLQNIDEIEDEQALEEETSLGSTNQKQIANSIYSVRKEVNDKEKDFVDEYQKVAILFSEQYVFNERSHLLPPTSLFFDKFMDKHLIRNQVTAAENQLGQSQAKENGTLLNKVNGAKLSNGISVSNRDEDDTLNKKLGKAASDFKDKLNLSLIHI
eukprot:TRINITY_DN6059_c0_g1_i3.p1 TRINITY_DN6059_c0_g1~~TRINITY_DN6059_c0_g1_i3.p1  ORF type:complete len:181 (-),score=58.55 TRINITY_DN6059_c0_g1_i3:63-605(-)